MNLPGGGDAVAVGREGRSPCTGEMESNGGRAYALPPFVMRGCVPLSDQNTSIGLAIALPFRGCVFTSFGWDGDRNLAHAD